MLKQFYATLASALQANGNVYLFTAISGPLMGSKALVKQNNQISIICSDLHFQAAWESIIQGFDLHTAPPFIENPDGSHIFMQRINTQPKLVIFGGGHISLPLAEIGKLLNFHVTVADEREEFANMQRFSQADQIICQPFELAVKEIEYTLDSYFVIVTRGHLYDRLCLEAILKKDFAYVGMIGSRSKIKVVMSHMAANGFSQALLKQVHTPIGLPIGAQSPAEIAVCIAAEIIQVKNQDLSGSYIDEAILQQLHSPVQPAALVTIVVKQGSSPREAGAQMLVLKDGSFLGTVGGGSGEKFAYNTALQVIDTRQPRLIEHDMTNTDASLAGMVCGGKITMFVEPI